MTLKPIAASAALLVGLAAASAGGAPAIGQPTQTVESAQAFLAITGRVLQVRVQADNGGFTDMEVRDMGPSQVPCQTRFMSTKAQTARAIAWPRVAEVKANGRYVSVRQLNTKTPSYTLRLDYQSESMAARAAFAMEFLRQACDPAADTGF